MPLPLTAKNVGRIAVAVTLLAGLASCGKSSDETPNSGGPQPSSEAPPPASSSTPTPTPTEAEEFDLTTIPVADPLPGDFPYFSIPDGYTNLNSEIPIDDYGKVPFWTGKDLQWVEGMVYQGAIDAEEGENFSVVELKKLIDDMIVEAGGVKIADSEMSQQAIADIDDDTIQSYLDGFGDIWNDTVLTYVIKTPDRTVWVHLCSSSAMANWMIVEAQE